MRDFLAHKRFAADYHQKYLVKDYYAGRALMVDQARRLAHGEFHSLQRRAGSK